MRISAAYLRQLKTAFLVVVVSLGLQSAAFGQGDRGTITGTVTDPGGAVVPNAAITAINTETGARYESVSTGTGNYTLVSIPAGVYNLEVASPGFGKFVQQGIRVQVAVAARIDVTLQVSSTSESVLVTADAPLLRTESGEQSHTLSYDRVLDLPLYGGNGRGSAGGLRSPYAFLNTMPGATIVPSGGNNSIRVNGLPNDTYSVRIEGQESTNTQQPNASHINPGVEALQEVTLQTSNFAAEYGQVGGGLINFTARSGTNQLHGSVFEYMRNEFLNASQPFSNVRPRTRSNNYGFTVGGPVVIPKVYDGHNR
ncbi:MAG TPA: TonB-dependent receptor, partial [Bryobacteraceae bacterium]|nr:TonB-dependent receptor [Bryobacteraceae bacterium]